MEFYKRLLETLEEGDSLSSINIIYFNICKEEDPEEHVHLEWSMKYDENNNIIFDNPDVALEALKYLSTPRAKFSEIVIRQVFTDEKIDQDEPAFLPDLSLNFDNFYHFMNKLEYSKKFSDNHFIVLAPTQIEIFEKENTFSKNEIVEEPIKSLMIKKPDLLKDIENWNEKPSSLKINVLIDNDEMEDLQEKGAKINNLKEETIE